MTKKIAVSFSKSEIYTVFKEYFFNKDVHIIKFDNMSELDAISDEIDLVVVEGFENNTGMSCLKNRQVVNLHKSLLPAFACSDALELAYRSGVKVSGVTIHYVGQNFYEGKIVAQYPVFIDSTTCFNEYEIEIYNVIQKLAPFVVESILNDVVFSYDMLLKPNGCDGSCQHCH